MRDWRILVLIKPFGIPGYSSMNTERCSREALFSIWVGHRIVIDQYKRKTASGSRKQDLKGVCFIFLDTFMRNL